MNPLLIAALIQAGSSIWGAYKDDKAAGKNAKRQGGISDLAQGMMTEGAGSSPAEQMLKNWLQNPSGGMGNMMSGKTFNMGQDSLMQMLRANPADGMNPAKDVIAAMQPIDDRMLQQTIGQLGAQSSGLGERLGGAMTQTEGMMRTQSAQDIGARNANLMMQGNESGMARLMQAIGMSQQGGLAEQSQWLGALGQLSGMGQQQNAGNANLLAIMAGLNPNMGGGSLPGQIGDSAMSIPMMMMMQRMFAPQPAKVS